MQRVIKALYVEPNALPEIVNIENNLKSKQKKVGGSIEYTRLPDDDDVVLICNEESKINGMEANRDIGYDIIFGPFLIVGDDPEIGDDRSLTEEQIRKYSKTFDQKSIEKTEEKIISLTIKEI